MEWKRDGRSCVMLSETTSTTGCGRPFLILSVADEDVNNCRCVYVDFCRPSDHGLGRLAEPQASR